MNERVRNIKYTLDLLKMKRNTCRRKLATVLNMDQELFSECLECMDKIKQARHIKTHSRHFNKFNRLQQKHYRASVVDIMNIFSKPDHSITTTSTTMVTFAMGVIIITAMTTTT